MTGPAMTPQAAPANGPAMMPSPGASGQTDPRAKAREFHRIACEVFAPLYPVVALQILEQWRRERPGAGGPGSRCLDIGSGAGHLGLALSAHSDLEVVLLDSNPHALELSREVVEAAGVQGRVKCVHASACDLPFGDGSFDLVVSRGSLWFWPDPDRAFREIWRILAPGGMAWVGGGFGTPELAADIAAKMEARGREPWAERQRKIRGDMDSRKVAAILDGMGIPWRLHDKAPEFWVELRR